MKILLVEDNQAKANEVATFIAETFPTATLELAHSYNSGVTAIIERAPQMVLLDMTMPTFDRSSTERGGRRRAYAGADILREAKRRALPIKAIVLTQFESFGDGSQRRSLSELQKELGVEFPGLYLGTVYYHPSKSSWRRDLTGLIRRAGIRKTTGKK